MLGFGRCLEVGIFMNNLTDTENINSKIAEYLVAIRSEIKMLRIDLEKKEEALKIVDVLDVQFKSDNPDKTVVTDLISTLPSAAIISSIGSSLLRCLK